MRRAEEKAFIAREEQREKDYFMTKQGIDERKKIQQYFETKSNPFGVAPGDRPREMLPH